MLPPSPLVDRRAALALVAILAGLVFANSLENRFAYDDLHIVVTNDRIHSLGTLPGALAQPYWTGDYGEEMGLWRPTTIALLGLQYAAGDGSPAVFHAVNVALHVLASVLVLLVLLELMPLAAAAAGALVFAVHPVHVEAVANVIGVAELASTAALLAACLIHLRSGERSGWRPAIAIGALYALGFGAKESAVTLPAIVFLLDAARARLAIGDLTAYLGRRWRVYVAMAGVAGAMLAARFAILGSVADPFAPLGGDLLREIPRIWTLAEVWTHYVRLWVFPLDLASDYSPNVIPISVGWNATNTVGLLLALGLLVVSLVAWRRPALGPEVTSSRMAAFGVVWFIVTISPVSNTVFLSGVLLAERTLYLPSVGLAAATGWLVARLARERPRGAWIGLAVALALSSARTWTRSPTWYDNATMLATLIDEHPQSGRSQWILGDAFLRQDRVSEGLRSYRAAIGILGTHYQLLTEISKQLLEIEHYRAAETLLEFAAENDPQFPLAHGLLALIRAEYGDAEGAERYARASLEREEFDPTRHHLLAWSLAAQGRLDEARAARARGLEQGAARFWQQYVYEAYARRAEGDPVAAHAALDSAWLRVVTEIGRATLDSVRVSEFGLEPLLEPAAEAEIQGNK